VGFGKKVDVGQRNSIYTYLVIAIKFQILFMLQRFLARLFHPIEIFLCGCRFDALSYVAEDLSGSEHAVRV
jgi:hypothetical protein